MNGPTGLLPGSPPPAISMDCADVTCLRPLRRQISALLAEHPLLRVDLCADAELVATELVTNALEHAAPPTTVHVTLTGRGMEIAVTDSVPGSLPTPGVSRLNRHRGHGFVLVNALTDGWGIRRDPTTKTVWAFLDGHDPSPAKSITEPRLQTDAEGPTPTPRPAR